MSVNFTPQQFNFRGLRTKIVQALTNSGLAPNRLKIELTESIFVEDLGASKNGHAVIRAITTLAAVLGMETLAEGVEDITQFEVLEREGCQTIQGCLFSRPVAADAVAGLLRDGAGYQGQLRA